MSYTAMPPYYTWIVDKLLAVSAVPFHHTHLKYLSENGIHTVVSISDQNEPPFHTSPQLKFVRLSLPQNGAPTLNDCHNFVTVMENAKRRREGVLVHSVKGTGRAGVLVACFLVKLWEARADYVIDQLRVMRPVSIENSEQEAAIYEFHDQVARGFQGFYTNKQYKWDPRTEFLGKELDMTVDNPIADSFTKRIQEPNGPY